MYYRPILREDLSESSVCSFREVKIAGKSNEVPSGFKRAERLRTLMVIQTLHFKN